MLHLLDISLHTYFLFALIIVAFICYAQDDIPMEFTAVGVIAAILLFFNFFPVLDAAGQNLLPSSQILAGFANPALISVLALLIVGQGVSKSGILETISRRVLALSMGKLWIAMLISLLTVLLISAFLNNIPVVIIFIPIIQSIAQRYQVPASKLLMPLSFVAVVGGMTTLVGSGTNLLVSDAVSHTGMPALGFFEFTVPGLLLAFTGLAYVTLIAPKLLPGRRNLSRRLRERSPKFFLAELEVGADSKLIGTAVNGDHFTDFPNLKVRMLHRFGRTFLPSFAGMHFRKGDVIAVASSRETLTDLLKSGFGLKLAPGFQDKSSHHEKSDQIIVEMMVTPSSSLIGQRIGYSGFEKLHNCEVLGFQHRANMVRSRIKSARLAAGDMLLVKCDEQAIRGLRDDLDVVLVEYSVEELPNWKLGHRAALIFLSVVLCAALNILPIVIAATLGALAMVGFNVLNIQQAVRAIDVKIVTTIAAALAIGAAMEVTGTASLLANLIISGTGTENPRLVLSAFFLGVALMSNIISTKTCAVLFAPIGLEMGAEIGIDPRIFAITIIFAANCAFMTPFAYQTSLLVMGPGSYKFKDFVIVGTPLLMLVWLVYTAFVPWYFGL